jgi:hypothetical protein
MSFGYNPGDQRERREREREARDSWLSFGYNPGDRRGRGERERRERGFDEFWLQPRR